MKVGGLGAGFEARCAEFRAGKEGGGRLSSSSLSLELWCSSSVNDGIAVASAELAVAFGVVAGDTSTMGTFKASGLCDSVRCCSAGRSPCSVSCDGLGAVGTAEAAAGAK